MDVQWSVLMPPIMSTVSAPPTTRRPALDLALPSTKHVADSIGASRHAGNRLRATMPAGGSCIHTRSTEVREEPQRLRKSASDCHRAETTKRQVKKLANTIVHAGIQAGVIVTVPLVAMKTLPPVALFMPGAVSGGSLPLRPRDRLYPISLWGRGSSPKHRPFPQATFHARAPPKSPIASAGHRINYHFKSIAISRRLM